jgi:molybdopterin-guanine dinucleotide biosynthesis protein A
MAHQKHAKLTRPIGGQWGRTEVAIMGAPCNEVKRLVAEITNELSKSWQIAYVDADHSENKKNQWTALHNGAKEQLTNKISHFELQHRSNNQHYFNDADLVLVNGNHFSASQQIIWVHPKKSLEKKLDKLTNIGLVILEDEISELPDFLLKHFADKKVTIVKRSDLKSIITFISTVLKESTPPLNGLVLIGGKSTRMQQDKSQLVYHDGIPQHEYMAGLLEDICDKVYVSVRDNEQAKTYNRKAITDKFIGLGPYGGILSALQYNPNAAWLVVAVDLPYLDSTTLKQLKSKRNIHKIATCFIDPKNEFPEPLITIWEPRAYPVLLSYLAKGYSCPRKALINSEVEIILDRDVKSLTNVNTPEEYKIIKKEAKT